MLQRSLKGNKAGGDADAPTEKKPASKSGASTKVAAKSARRTTKAAAPAAKKTAAKRKSA
jgi:hypothetical protein